MARSRGRRQSMLPFIRHAYMEECSIQPTERVSSHKSREQIDGLINELSHS